MNLLNKRSGIITMGALLLATALISPALSGNEKKIRVPEEVLEKTIITQKEVNDKIDLLEDWLKSWGKERSDKAEKKAEKIEPKKSAEKNKKQDDKDKVEEKKKAEVKLTLQNFRQYAGWFSAMQTSKELLDDVREVTGIKTEWYKNVSKHCDQISVNLRRIEQARIRGSQKVFDREFKLFKANCASCVRELKKRDHSDYKIKPDELKKLKEDNKDRRRDAYIAAEKAKAAQKAKAEKSGKNNKSDSRKE